MHCPGRAECAFGARCELGPEGRPGRWAPCQVEVLREERIRAGLLAWTARVEALPGIVDPAWFREIVEAYVHAQLRFERLWRYLIGADLLTPDGRLERDPVVRRHAARILNRRDQLRFYLLSLIGLVSRAEAAGRERPFPGDRRRDGRWLTKSDHDRPATPGRGLGRAPRPPQPPNPRDGSFPSAAPRRFRARRVHSWIRQERRRLA
jgi:hypothetical protein